MATSERKKKKKDRDPGLNSCDCGPNCDIPGCDLFTLSTLLLLTAVVAGTAGRTGRGYAERMVLALIRGYRRISPRLPTRCRYAPTCSAYALAAVERHGLGRGLRLAAARLTRCRPSVTFGTADPVP